MAKVSDNLSGSINFAVEWELVNAMIVMLAHFLVHALKFYEIDFLHPTYTTCYPSLYRTIDELEKDEEYAPRVRYV